MATEHAMAIGPGGVGSGAETCPRSRVLRRRLRATADPPAMSPSSGCCQGDGRYSRCQLHAGGSRESASLPGTALDARADTETFTQIIRHRSELIPTTMQRVSTAVALHGEPIRESGHPLIFLDMNPDPLV